MDWQNRVPGGRSVVALVAMVAMAGSALGQAGTAQGRYLNRDAASLALYNQAVATEFNANVVCGMLGNVGTVQFSYNTYGTARAGGGGALAGGFFINPAIQLRPGRRLAWAQTVTATTPGNNEWGINAGNNREFPDTNNGRTSPRYPFESLDPSVPAPAGLTLGFVDFPSRVTTAAVPVQNWLAELTLICVDTEPPPNAPANAPARGQLSTAWIIGSLLWGFSMNNNPAPNGTLTADPPGLWGPVTASWIATQQRFFPNPAAAGVPNTPEGLASARWQFINNGCSECFIPAPGTAALLAFAGVLATRRRR